jgi:hypothetical protein
MIRSAWIVTTSVGNTTPFQSRPPELPTARGWNEQRDVLDSCFAGKWQ